MNWVKTLISQIKKQKMTEAQLWHLLSQQNHKAFGLHVDNIQNSIVFGDKYNCGYADFEHATGKLMVHGFSPYWNSGEDFNEVYEHQEPAYIYRRLNFLPRHLWLKYQDMRGTLLPVCDLFINQNTVDMDYDAKPDHVRATYRIESDKDTVRNIDGIYTAESINDDILTEVLQVMTNGNHKMSLADARRIIKEATVNFGAHCLVLLKIPSKPADPAAREFPYVLRSVLNQHYENSQKLLKADEANS